MKLEKEIIKMEQKVDAITENQGRNSSTHREQFQDQDAMTKIQEFAQNPDPWLSSPAKQCLREIEGQNG